MARFMIKASEYKNVCKAVNDRKLAELKKEIIEILKKQDEKEVKKAIDYFNSQELHYTHLEKSFTGKWIEKAGYGIGTVRIWKGKKYKKIAPGKWARVFEKEGRGTNIAIGKLIARVQRIDNVEDLMAFVMQNKQRFVDENGVDLPFLDKLRAAVEALNGIVGIKTARPFKNANKEDLEYIVEQYKKRPPTHEIARKQRDQAVAELSARELEKPAENKYKGLSESELQKEVIKEFDNLTKENKAHGIDYYIEKIKNNNIQLYETINERFDDKARDFFIDAAVERMTRKDKKKEKESNSVVMSESEIKSRISKGKKLIDDFFKENWKKEGFYKDNARLFDIYAVGDAKRYVSPNLKSLLYKGIRGNKKQELLNIKNRIDTELEDYANKLFKEYEQKEESEAEKSKKVTAYSSVKDWYKKEFPSDDLGNDLTDASFQDIYDGIKRGTFKTADYADDSVVRERIFEKIAEIKNIPYDIVYSQWLQAEQDPKEKESKDRALREMLNKQKESEDKKKTETKEVPFGGVDKNDEGEGIEYLEMADKINEVARKGELKVGDAIFKVDKEGKEWAVRSEIANAIRCKEGIDKINTEFEKTAKPKLEAKLKEKLDKIKEKLPEIIKEGKLEENKKLVDERLKRYSENADEGTTVNEVISKYKNKLINKLEKHVKDNALFTSKNRTDIELLSDIDHQVELCSNHLSAALYTECKKLLEERGVKVEKSLFGDFITDMLVDEVIEDEEVEENESEYNDYSAEHPDLFNSTEFLVREALNRRYNCKQ